MLYLCYLVYTLYHYKVYSIHNTLIIIIIFYYNNNLKNKNIFMLLVCNNCCIKNVIRI